jgi:transcriptional regulator with XRE-family HTH domain
MDRFGAKLTALRKKRGLTTRQLGEMLGVYHTYVSQIE